MRNRNKAFLSCAVLAGVLLAAVGAMAQTPTPSGTCYAGAYRVDAFGPSFVACPAGGDCTQIEYQISGGTPDHVATVVASGVADCSQYKSILDVTGGKTGGNQWYFPAEGDPVTGLGKYACHEEAAKINPNDTVTFFKVVVKGQRSGAPKSVVTKKGGTTRSCEIVGIGDAGTTPNPFQTNLKTEKLVFKGCAVNFTYNLATGEVVSAALDPNPPNKPQCVGGEPAGSCCTFDAGDVSDLDVTFKGTGLGAGKFGEGYISTGSNSCTTRVIGGRVYTWGDPCPE